MKNIIPILAASLLALTSCSQNTRTVSDGGKQADTATATTSEPKANLLSAKMTVNLADSVKLKFTVFNDSGSAQQFCKWHTPFEGFISKYLDITAEDGEEVAYKGAMAKRIMPPPADSYIKVNAGDSISAEANLSEGYNFTKSGRYTLRYNSQAMSGLNVKDSVVFIYNKK